MLQLGLLAPNFPRKMRQGLMKIMDAIENTIGYIPPPTCMMNTIEVQRIMEAMVRLIHGNENLMGDRIIMELLVRPLPGARTPIRYI